MNDQKFDTNESNASLSPEKEKKNFFSRVGDTVSLFFTKDTNKAIETIIDPEAPMFQRTAAIKSAVVKRNFDLRIFLSGFFGNALLSIALTYLGEKLNVDIYLAAIIVFVGRMFLNLGVIRRYYVEKWFMKPVKSNSNSEENKENNF